MLVAEKIKSKLKSKDDDAAALRLSKLEANLYYEGQKVAALSQGDYWEATIVKVMKRKRSGTMYRVKFSDKSEQVVDKDGVKPIDDEES